VNGVAAHGLEMDDTHQPGSLHPGVTVFSAALALLDEEGPENGGAARFVPAVIAGYEVACRVAVALQPADHYDRGFHPTATAGAFGAAMAAGLVAGLDEDELVNALGIAGSMPAGLMEFLTDGTWTKRLHPGWAAHAGISAMRLAQSGYTGPATVFEGRHGFLSAYAPHPRPEALTDGLGDEFQILRTSIKAHACCRYKQAPIDGIIQIMRDRSLTADDVERVTIGVLGAGWEIIAAPDEQKRDPRSVVDAQFSMPYGAAVALLRGSASPAEYTPAVIADAAVRQAMARVVCVRDPALDGDFPARWPATVAIRTRDGRSFSTRIDFPKGDPENPLTPAELEAKFRSLTRDVLAVADQDRIIAAAAGVLATGGVTALAGVLRAVNERVSAVGVA
jgi:2-methylcitrate dehydratase PrpD